LAFYENVFISRQDLAPQQAEALAQTFTEVVTGQGGKVTKSEYWGLRNLAFPIKKNRKGHYTLLNLDAPPAVIAELERQMRLHEDVLRYLTVKVEELEEGPSAMLQRREERAERERGDRDRGGFRGGGFRGDRPMGFEGPGGER
jgi:small subunit ribosomal protein S6